MRFTIVLLAVIAAALPGCAGRSPFSWWGNHTASRHGSHNPMVVTTGKQSSEQLADQLAKAQQPKKKTIAEKISTAFKTQKHKPTVTKAPDPTNLHNMPKKINAEVYVEGARLLESRNQLAAAEKQYLKALQVEPENLIALVSMARLKDRQNDFQKAIEYYGRAVGAHPKNALPSNDMGLCYARHGKLGESAASLRRAVKLQPGNKMYRNNLAKVLVQQGENSEALTHLTAAHGEAVAHYNLGYMLHARGDNAKAVEHFAIASSKSPSLTAAKKMLARLQADGPSLGDQQNIAHGSEYRLSDDQSIAGSDDDSTGDTALNRGGQFSDEQVSKQPAAMNKEVGADYTTIRLPEVEKTDWRDNEGPQAPTPDQVQAASASEGGPYLLPPVE